MAWGKGSSHLRTLFVVFFFWPWTTEDVWAIWLGYSIVGKTRNVNRACCIHAPGHRHFEIVKSIHVICMQANLGSINTVATGTVFSKEELGWVALG